MDIYISSGAFKTTDLAEMLEVAKRAGISKLELSSGLRLPEGGLARLKRARSEGMRFLVHNYFPAPDTPFVLNLGSTEAASRRQSLDHCRRAVDICAELGSAFYSVHSGFAVHAKPGDLGHDLTLARRSSRAEAQLVFVESLRELCAYAAKASVSVAIENNVLAAFNLVGGKNELLLGVTQQEMLETLAAVGAPNLGLLLDVAHARVSATALGFDADEFLRAVKPKVMALHLSDNDGRSDQNWPVTSNSWFLPHLPSFRDVPAVLESYKLEPAQIQACSAAIEAASAAAAP